MSRPRAWLAAPAAIVGIVFFAWPMASILGTGIGNEPGALGSVFTSARTRGAIWFTIWQAGVSTLLTLIIALPATWAVSRFTFPGRRLVRTALTIPFVLPTVVVALAFIELLGPSGLLGVDLLGTAAIVIAAHVFFNIAVVVRTVGGLWSHLDPTLEAAAASLGANPWRVFRTVTLPLLRPAIGAAAAIVFLFSFTSFGVVLLLGAPRLATIEIEIYRSAALLPDLPAAAALALVQVIGVTIGLLVYARLQERSSVRQHLLPATATLRRPTGPARWWVAGALTPAVAIAVLPIGAVLARAVRTGGIGALGRVESAFVDVSETIANSVQFGAITAVLAVVVALPAAVLIASRRAGGRWIDTLLMLPVGSSAVTLGFGFVVGLDAPIDMRSWWVLIPIAHLLVAMPFVIRATVPVLRSIAPRIREAAATLGAAPGRLWRTIDLPLVSPAAAGAAALAFVISLGEFGATLFAARPGGQTMTIAIFRLLGRPGETNAAAALGLAVLLITITAVVVSILERSRVPGVGSF